MADPPKTPLLVQALVGDDDCQDFLVAFYGEAARGMDCPSWLDVYVWEVNGTSEDRWRLADVKEGISGNGADFMRADWDAGKTPPHSDVYMHGDIKWDGCSNWYFDEQDRCMLHFCGSGSWRSLDNLMRTVYATGRDIMGSDCQ